MFYINPLSKRLVFFITHQHGAENVAQINCGRGKKEIRYMPKQRFNQLYFVLLF